MTTLTPAPTTTFSTRTIDLGTTTLGDLYSLPGHPVEGRATLAGYLDPCSATAFVGDDGGRFASMVNGYQVDGRLRVPNGRGVDDYRIADIGHVDLHQKISTTAVVQVQDAACVNTTGCIRLLDGEGNLLGSFRTNRFLCIDTPGQTCIAQFQSVVVDLFPNATCFPRSTPTQVSIAFC